MLSTEPGHHAYLWTDGSTASRNVVRQGGVYTVTTISASGCRATSDPITVIAYPRDQPKVLPEGPRRLCQGDLLTLEVGPQYVGYRWSTGQVSRTLDVTQSGRYKVYTVDRNGCRDSSEEVVVTVFPRPSPVTVTPPGPIVACSGEQVILTASQIGSNETYLWSSGQTTRSITVTKTGSYVVTVTNEHGCSVRSLPVEITVHPRPSLQISSGGLTSFCEGDSLFLQAIGTFTTQLWSTGQRTPFVFAKQAGEIRVTVTDANGCTADTSVYVSITPAPKPVVRMNGPSAFCQGDSVTLDAGAGFTGYLWSNGATEQRIIARESGRFSVSVTDRNGCKGRSDTVEVRMLQRPAASVTGPTTVCPGSTVTYAVANNPGVVYQWKVNGAGGGIVSGAGSNAIVVAWGSAGSGSVDVSVTDGQSGCVSLARLEVSVGNVLVPAVTASGPLALCPSQSVTLDAGPGYASYLWSSGETSQSITVSIAGSYSVTVQTAAGCGGSSAPIVVTTNQAPEPLISVAGPTAICPGGSVRLSAPESGRYLWSNGFTTRDIMVTQPGSYSVTVTDANGCRGTSPIVTVTQQAPPRPSIDGPAVLCTGSTVSYSVADSGNSNFTWSVTGGAIVSGQGSAGVVVAWGSGPGGSVEVLQRSTTTGCSGSSRPLAVQLGTELHPAITSTGTDICKGDSTILSAEAGHRSYLWSTGEQTRSIVVTAAGRYRVSVRDDGGCSGEASIDIDTLPALVVAITPTGLVELCDGDRIQIEAPDGFAAYRWSNGESTRAIQVSKPGEYSVRVTSENGCRGWSDTLLVNVHPLPATPIISRSGDSLVSTAAYAYQWLIDGKSIPGAIQRRYLPREIGQHYVRITDSNGCSALSLPIPGAVAIASVSLPSIEATPGERLLIPLLLDASQNLERSGAAEFIATIRFNRTLLLPSGGTPLGRIEGGDRVVTITGRREPATTTGPIAMLELIAALGDTAATALRIDSIEWPGAPVRVSTTDGEVRITTRGGWKLYQPGGVLALLSPIPNPASGLTDIIYETIEQGRTRVDLIDLGGRLVASLVDTEQKPGRRRVTLDAAGLASGAYFLVLQTPSGRIVRVMQVWH